MKRKYKNIQQRRNNWYIINIIFSKFQNQEENTDIVVYAENNTLTIWM